jgi:hypothetical protein
MSTIEFPDLHPESQAVIAALLDSTLDDSSQMAVSEEALARFAFGWVTAEESEAIVAALTISVAMRNRLMELRDSIRDAEASASSRLQVFEKEKGLGEVMTAALHASIRLLSRWSKAWSPRTEISSLSLEEKRSLRALLRGLGTSLQAAPAQPAVARNRGIGQAARVVVEPGDVFADLSVHVASDESLVAKAEFSRPFTEPKEISLYVVESGGAWAWIGSSIANGSRWILKTPQYAGLLGLPSGDVASHSFALSEGRWLMPRGWISLQVSRDLKDRRLASPTRLRLRRPPIISGGMFAIAFELPESLREVFAEDCLSVSIALGSAEFVLGSWKVKDLPPTSEIELQAALEGVADCDFESSSAIHLIMRPG